jgi:medium-chain acyl-[acyl-carrier-protein] hydrolase
VATHDASALVGSPDGRFAGPVQVLDGPAIALAPPGERWFRRAQVSSPSVRLFCFPFAGGKARVFREWVDWCRPDVEVVAVELPGRGANSHSPLIDRMNTMIERLIPALDPLLDTEFAFFGHSMGALIAFELARALQAKGRKCPSHLFVSGMRPPHLKGQYEIHNLPDRQLIEALRVLNGIPAEITGDTSMVEVFLPLLRADLRLAENYRYTRGPALRCPITVFSGIQDITTPVQHQQEWRRHTRASCAVRCLEGDHFFIQQSAHAMAASILKSLNKPSFSAELEATTVMNHLEVKSQETEPAFSGAD